MRSRGAALLPWAVLWPIILGWAGCSAECVHDATTISNQPQQYIKVLYGIIALLTAGIKPAHLYRQMILSQIKALIWASTLLCCPTHWNTDTAGSPVSGPTFCVYEGRCVCIVSMLRISWWNLTACLHGGAKRSFDVLQEAATHSENVLSVVTVYKPVWRITQGRKVSGMNYGYHMSGAGTDSWARALFEDWNPLINVAMQKKSKLFNRYYK